MEDNDAEGDLRLARMSEKARSVFVITQLISIFKIFETVAEAKDSYINELILGKVLRGKYSFTN